MKPIFIFIFLLLILVSNGQKSTSIENFYSVERYNKLSDLPEYIVFTSRSITSENFLVKIKLVKGFEKVSFRLLNIETDPIGNKHYRYIQEENGIALLGSMFIAHEQNGIITSCNGAVFETPKSPIIMHSGKEALEVILSKNKNTVYYFQKPDANAWLQSISGNASNTFNPPPYLVILPSQLNEVYHTTRLVYAVDLFAIKPLSRKIYYLDAMTLDILFIEDRIETTDIPGKANTKYSGTQNITTDSVQPGTYRLRETVRGSGQGIETYNMQKGSIYTTATDFYDADNNWTNYNSNFDEVAGDVHWGTEKTYDFFKNVFNRNSIDNNGFKLISYVHYSTNYVNAFWNGYFMTYGDGGSGYLPLTSLDVCGHEITHGLTQKTAALVYSNESGALNESFSDIFGVAIDFYTSSATANFKMGEQFGPGGTALRDMSNPKQYQNPNTYKGQYWVSNKSDNGGVHYNSGVQNKWFYLLCHGDTGTNDNGFKFKVDSIGYLNAAQISFLSLTTFLTPLSNYDDARFYSILAAKQLFGDCSNEVMQVINAWQAVGVGGSDTAVKSAFTSTKHTACNVPLTVQFYNNSANSNASVWDFGDGQTSLQTNPTHTYTTVANFSVKLVSSSCNTIDKDSITLTQYIKIDPALRECQLNRMPKSGVGIPLTACSGLLSDDGDTSDYDNLIYSVRSITPANASVLKLTFNEFDFENNFDFLYVYDGVDTLGKLIGKYTGNALPNGGSIICKTGAATLRQTSDFLIGGKGFELNWQCIAKTANDFKLDAPSDRIFGRKNTSSELKSSQNVTLNVTSVGTQPGTSTTLKYKLNNGAVTSKNVSLTGGTAITTVGPFDLSQAGTSTLSIWIADGLDGVKENDTLIITIQQVDNPPVSLPLIDNFDAMADVWLYTKTFGVGGSTRTDYENTSPQCRLRTFAGTDFGGGTRAITLDKSDRNWLFDTLPQTNFLTLTYNMSAIANLPSPLLFRFTYTQHGDKKYPNDAVWTRGCDTAKWIKFFDLFANKTIPGSGKTTPIYNLNYYLDSAKQTLSSSFQIRIGQQDQNSTINTQQYTGYTFDNLRFSTWNTGIKENEVSSEMALYPNPSSGIFMVYTAKKRTRVEVKDLKGALVSTILLPNTNYFEMDLSNLEKSIYVLSFYDDLNIPRHQKVLIR